MPAVDALAGDTLVALATAPQPAGVAIVRLSGPRAHAIACRLAGRSLLEPARLTFCSLRDLDGALLDRGYVVVLPGPRTFTGEDVAELQVHGSPAVITRLIEVSCLLGARPALPGEFSRRAFVHGRLDLTQAEALLDLLSARTEAARMAALEHLDGGLCRALADLRQPIVHALADVEARLDFASEADVDALDTERLAGDLDDLQRRIEALAGTARAARVRLHGARVVLYGAPNAGKSTLLNALCGSERALVDARPGTTRDTIEVPADLAGLGVSWIDTAGVRDAEDPVEARGAARATAEARAADVVLWLQDAGAPLAELPDPGEPPPTQEHPPPQVLRVLSKCDRPRHPAPETDPAWAAALRLSVQDGVGLESLRQAVARAVRGLAEARADGVALHRARHTEALARAAESLARAREALATLPLECVAADLREAADALAEVTGVVAPSDVLAAVFGQFCIGK